MRKRFGLAVFTAFTALAAQAGPLASTQAGQLSPMEQRAVDAQLAAPKLDPRAIVTTLELAGTTMGDAVRAIAKFGDINVRYHSAVTGLDAMAAAAKLANTSVEDALSLTLRARALTFKTTGSKSVFVYPDTPANREKYADSVRTFAITKADIAALSNTLNRSLGSLGADELRPTIVSLRESRTVMVRATPDVMARIAKVIADNDK